MAHIKQFALQNSPLVFGGGGPGGESCDVYGNLAANTPFVIAGASDNNNTTFAQAGSTTTGEVFDFCWQSYVYNFTDGAFGSDWKAQSGHIYIDHEIIWGGGTVTFDVFIYVRTSNAASHPGADSVLVLQLLSQSGDRARVTENFRYAFASPVDPTDIAIFARYESNTGTKTLQDKHKIYDMWIQPSFAPGALGIL